jgi:ABC-type thiamine transport system substrate-binding protein
MYVYPVNENASIPDEWAEFGPAANSTIGEKLNISTHREKWQTKWSEIFE